MKVKLSLRSDVWYFVRSGYAHYNGHTNWSSINGYGWSSRTYTSTGFQGGFSLDFLTLDVYPSGDNGYSYRLFGFPLRCLVR